MKRSGKIMILTGILMFLTCVFFLVQQADLSGTEDLPEITEATSPLLSADASAITAVCWTAGEEELAFTADGSRWCYAADETLPVDAEAVKQLLDSFCAAVSAKTITSPGDLDQYGLADPALTVKLTAGNELTVAFGDVTDLSGKQYCLTDDGSVHLTDATVAELFALTLSDFVQKDEVPQTEDITSFEVTNSEGGLTAVRRTEKGLTYTDDFVWFTSADTAAALDTQRTETLLSKALQPEFGEYAANGTSEEVLSAYGLSPADMTVTVNYSDPAEDGTTQSATFTVSFGADEDGNTFASLSGSTRIWHVDSEIYEAFATAVKAKFLPEKAFSLDWADVKEAVITLDGETHTVIRMKREVAPADGEDSDEEPYLETYWMMDSAEAELNPVKDALNAVTASGDAPEKEPALKEEISFTFLREGELHPETTVTFYRDTAAQCITVIDGVPTVYASRSDVIALKEAVYAIVLG